MYLTKLNVTHDHYISNTDIFHFFLNNNDSLLRQCNRFSLAWKSVSFGYFQIVFTTLLFLFPRTLHLLKCLAETEITKRSSRRAWQFCDPKTWHTLSDKISSDKIFNTKSKHRQFCPTFVWLLYWNIGKIFEGQNFSSDKIFDTKPKFRQLSDEFLSDRVIHIHCYVCFRHEYP